jgi:hypothetical protein
MRNSLLPIFSLVAIAAFLIFLFSELRRQVARDLAEKRRQARLLKLVGTWTDPTGFYPAFILEKDTLVYLDQAESQVYRIEVLNDVLLIHLNHSIDKRRIVSVNAEALILENEGEEITYVKK